MNQAQAFESIQIKPGQTFLSTHLGKETVILNLEDGIYYGLNEMGSWIWRALESSRTHSLKMDDLRDQVLSEFEVQAKQCESDLRAWALDLKAHGFLITE